MEVQFILRLLQVLLLFDLGIQQLPDSADHDIEAQAQLGDFIHIAVRDQCLQVILGHG